MWRRGERGFSLIEGLIVISIVFIMAAVAAPQFRDVLMRYQLESKARNVEGLVHTARREAARQNRRVSLRILPASPTWFAYVDTNGNKIMDQPERRVAFPVNAAVIPSVWHGLDLASANVPDYGTVAPSLSALFDMGYTFSPDGTLLDRTAPTGPWMLDTQIRFLTVLQLKGKLSRYYLITITPAGNTRMWTTEKDTSAGALTEPVSPV